MEFRFWCQKVLPLVYDDSLSYYELICKIHEYINNILKDNKELANEVKDLYSKLEELKTYVDNYFNNLDIQKEIDVKIDELVKDGTIPNIIEDIITNIYTLETGNYTNNSLVKQIVYGVGQSYYMNAWKTRNNNIDYGNIEDNSVGNGTALDKDVLTYGKIDCSTFVLLCLLGINYADSPYNGVSINNNGKIGFGRQFINTINNDTGLIRWAYELLMYSDYNKLSYTYVNPSQIQTGDVIFWCWDDEYVKKQSDDWWGKNTYKYCAHVGIAVQNCSEFKSGVGVLQAVSTPAVTNFSDFLEYTERLTNQHMYPKIMRPRLNVDTAYFKGLWRFRGEIDKSALVLNKSAIQYLGGKMPTNMSKNKVDKSNGSLSPDNSRYTTYFIPYNISMFVTNNTSNVGYNICYYDVNKNYLSYSQNKWVETPNCVYVRIEYYNRNDGDLDATQINNILSSNLLTYHTWCDSPQGFENKQSPDIGYLDTIMYFEEATRGNPEVVLNGV